MKSAARASALVVGLLSISAGWAQQAAGSSPAGVSQTQPASQPALDQFGARLELSPNVFNFGEVWQGAPARGEFHLKNTGNAPLTLSVTSSCGCTIATKPKSPLNPGESDTFSITYDTKRSGPADKKVTVSSNDPTQPNVVIDVKGTVKPIFATKPEDCTFQNAEENTVATQTVRLENKYTRPLPLRIKAGQNIEQFELELKEVEPGMVYELQVTTRPPLSPGKNMTSLALETGLPDLPDISIRLSADVQPRASLMPMAIFVTPDKKKPFETMLTVQYRSDKPLKIVDIRPELESIKCEVLPPGPAQEGATVGYHQIRVSLPPFAEIPEQGTNITINTDDPDPKFASLQVPVTRREGRRRPVQMVPATQAHAAPDVPTSHPQPEPKK
jgi:hypothetical protein